VSAPTKIAVLGAGFIADVHLESYHRFVPDAQVTAVCSRTPEHAQAIAARYHVPLAFTDVATLLAEADCDIVDICLPNDLHVDACLAAAAAGKHVICEKPLAVTLEQADAMIEACARAGVKLMYAEELCFAPKYERVRRLVSEGALGRVYQLRQSEKHSGPHSDWFYDIDRAGGGVLMDMGCHAFAWFRWMLGGNPRVERVFATMSTVLHRERTRAEDNLVAIVEFEGGVIGVAEDSWAKPGGMDDRIEVYGTGGVSYADLFAGNAALTFSEAGYGYALEKAGSTRGWTFTVFEEAFNQGYPQELQHFVQCVREDRTPHVTGEDGRAVLEMIYAAYESAGLGRAVVPGGRRGVARPIDLWLSHTASGAPSDVARTIPSPADESSPLKLR
jgi:myo-inositol 2-dehydrogenase / D-chiro-inositol 1-dehydrogenase